MHIREKMDKIIWFYNPTDWFMAMKSFTVHEYSRDVYSRAILKQNVSPFEFICLQKYLKCFANRHFEFLNVNKKDNFFIEKSLCRWITSGEMHSFRRK